ncbi:DUF4870 domain-containing protein [Candidatus Azambacteria bacterium]|nr:DUF4870 domain-containing protein [Candidatus Azambacteria bacterium]
MDVQNTNAPAEGSAPQKTAEKNVLMAVLAYIGPLIIVSYVTAKDDAFVKFHIKQGLVLFVIELGVWVLGMMLWQLWPLLSIVNLATIVLSIIGIINAVKGKEEQLPLVGKFSQYFPL